MPTVDSAIVLMMPPELLWSRVTELRDLPRWLEGVTAVRSISTAQTQPGTTFEIVRAAQRRPEHWIVVDWQPLQSLRLTDYHQDRHLRLRLQPIDGGTRLHLQHEWRAPRGLLWRLLPSAQDRSLARSLERLKRWLEV